MATLDDAIAAMTGETDVAQEAPPETEEVLEEEAVAEPEAEETEEPEAVEEKLYAGKYKSLEDLEKAYVEAQSALGRQGDELGQLRKIQEQFQEQLAQLSQPAAPNPFDTPEWDNINFDNPAQARQAALWVAQNQPFNYESFLESWYDQSPRAATAFEMEMKDYEWEQKLEDRFGTVADIPQKLEAEERAQANTVAFEQVWANLHAQNPDLNEFAEKIIEEASQTPALAAVFQHGDQQQMEGALQILLNAARYRRSQAQEIADAQGAEAAQSAKSKANLTKATASAGSQSKTPSSGDRILEALERESRERGWWGEPAK